MPVIFSRVLGAQHFDDAGDVGVGKRGGQSEAQGGLRELGVVAHLEQHRRGSGLPGAADRAGADGVARSVQGDEQRLPADTLDDEGGVVRQPLRAVTGQSCPGHTALDRRDERVARAHQLHGARAHLRGEADDPGEVGGPGAAPTLLVAAVNQRLEGASRGRSSAPTPCGPPNLWEAIAMLAEPSPGQPPGPGLPGGWQRPGRRRCGRVRRQQVSQRHRRAHLSVGEPECEECGVVRRAGVGADPPVGVDGQVVELEPVDAGEVLAAGQDQGVLDAGGYHAVPAREGRRARGR